MDFQECVLGIKRICIRIGHPWVQAVLYHFTVHVILDPNYISITSITVVILHGNYDNEINYYLLKHLAQCPAYSECSIYEAILSFNESLP